MCVCYCGYLLFPFDGSIVSLEGWQITGWVVAAVLFLIFLPVFSLAFQSCLLFLLINSILFLFCSGRRRGDGKLCECKCVCVHVRVSVWS